MDQILERIKSYILPSESNEYKSKFLQSNTLLYCVVLLLALKIVATLIFINLPANMFFADITKSALENSINQTRQSLGLAPLLENAKLNQAAQAKAQNMVQNNYFDHTSPTGVSPWFWFAQAGYRYKYAGENLAIGFYDSQEVYNAWLNSPSHKANIVNPHYTEVGTAVLGGFGPNNSVIVVQEFASPLPVKPAPVASNSKPVAVTQPKPKPVPAPAPVAKPAPQAITEPQTPSENEQVLSQTTQLQNFIEPASANGSDNLSLRMLNFVTYNYDMMVQGAIYGLSLVVIGILLALILLNFNFTFKRQLVYRAVLIVILLSLATALNRELVIAIIPHQVMI